MTVFISLAGWLAFVNYNTSYFCKATHELAPPQNPRPQTLLLLSLRHRSHLTGGTLGSGLGFRIWVQGYRVQGLGLGYQGRGFGGFRVQVSSIRVQETQMESFSKGIRDTRMGPHRSSPPTSFLGLKPQTPHMPWVNPHTRMLVPWQKSQNPLKLFQNITNIPTCID